MSKYDWYFGNDGTCSYQQKENSVKAQLDKTLYHGILQVNDGIDGGPFDIQCMNRTPIKFSTSQLKEFQEYIDYIHGEWNRYYKSLRSQLTTVFSKLLTDGSKIRSVWKLPAPMDCILYAETEAAEYLEAALLQVRTTDSRNNKKLEDYDTQTEMFDVSMMLMRFITAFCEEHLGIKDDTEEGRMQIMAYFNSLIDKYIEKKMLDIIELDYSYSNIIRPMCYEQEPSQLLYWMTAIFDVYNSNEFPEKLPECLDCFIFDLIFEMFERIVFHPFMMRDLVLDYVTVASNKIDKIYNKSIAKMENEQ